MPDHPVQEPPKLVLKRDNNVERRRVDERVPTSDHKSPVHESTAEIPASQSKNSKRGLFSHKHNSPPTTNTSRDLFQGRNDSTASDDTLVNPNQTGQHKPDHKPDLITGELTSADTKQQYLGITPRVSLEGQGSSQSSLYALDVEKQIPPPAEAPHHTFGRSQKKQLIYIISAAAIFSPLSSNIYFPALGQISQALNTDIAVLSFSVTVYMVAQGIAPSFWGGLADQIGRRQIFIGTFIVYLIANAGLGLSNSFAMLMVFRAIQAAGSSATISIGAGVIGDITTAKERGSLIGIFGGLRMMGQSIGPVFGGIIAQYFGFRAIFWFLLIIGSMSLATIIIFLPETLRSIAGNGSVELKGINKPLIYYIRPQKDVSEPPRLIKPKISVVAMLSPLRFLFEKDVFVTLFFGSIVYTVWSMVTSSTTAILQAQFGLNDIITGLCFLPNGFGCVSGSVLTGYLMDYDYKKTEREYIAAKGLPADTKLNKKELLDFPIERSRLRSTWWIIMIFVITTTLYGFSIRLNILALPLILQFFIAYTATSVFSFNSALVIDLYPGASASATAVNNLIRCLMGAAGVGVVQFVIDAVGTGVTFALFAAITAGLTPLLMIEWKWGQKWRGERAERMSKKKAKKEQKDLEAAERDAASDNTDGERFEEKK